VVGQEFTLTAGRRAAVQDAAKAARHRWTCRRVSGGDGSGLRNPSPMSPHTINSGLRRLCNRQGPNRPGRRVVEDRGFQVRP